MKYTQARSFARELRKNQTKAEASLWKRLRNGRLEGYKFSRQYLIEHSKGAYFIADFYCHQARLIVEVDGEIHLKQQDYDQNRDQILRSLGYEVLRLKNREVLKDWIGTDKKILNLIESRLNHP